MDLSERARSLVGPGKGLLAIDETMPHADRWLAEHGIPGTPEMRRAYRELFFTAPSVEEYLSGAILFSQTVEESSEDGTPFPKLLADRGIAPGIKVDGGTEPFPGSPDETITNGILGLPHVLHDYAAKGMVFTKWRGVVRIEGTRLPTTSAVLENAKRLAVYAIDVQKSGMVPILEFEILLEGTHSRVRSKEVLMESMKMLIASCMDQAVDFGSMLIKTSMALSGSESGKKDTPEEVAEDTVAALLSTVPKQVAGIVFLSGGQTSQQATENLNAIAKRAIAASAPWPLTFSYARALQDEGMRIWQGKGENKAAAQAAFLERVKEVSAASKGAL